MNQNFRAKTNFRAILTLAALSAAIYAPANTSASDTATTPKSRAEGIETLDKILGQEKGVGKLLLIKHPRNSIKVFLKSVAEASKTADEDIQAWEKRPPGLHAETDGFPSIEEAARAKMQSDLTKSLLLSGGKNFERRVLVSQLQATEYLSHVMGALEGTETNDSHKKWLKEHRERFEKFHDEAFSLLGVKP